VSTAGSRAAPRLHEQVRRTLEREIREGRHDPARPLMEAPIAKRFGVSRAPVRRALHDLCANGLVRKLPRRGYALATAVRGASEPGPEDDASGEVELADPLRARATWQGLYAEVERAIASRQPFAAWRLTEVALGDYYGVSRTVARDLLARLERVGVVEKDERMRWLVPRLTAEHLAQLYEVRWLLEPAALLKAAPHVATAELTRMRRELEAAIDALPALEGGDLARLEHELHVDLLAHADNRPLLRALGAFQATLIAHHHVLYVVPHTPREDPLFEEHLAVVGALERGHPARAAATLRRHLRRSLARATRRMAAIPPHYEPPPLPYLVRLD